jgi:hypothetical protein
LASQLTLSQIEASNSNSTDPDAGLAQKRPAPVAADLLG